tara:strand:- start:186 stop:362 length:177 start_codon:yes stop_codon:yes gene_type:complete
VEYKQTKKNQMESKKQEKLTTAQRIEQLKAQQEQAKEVFVKCQGAIEVLEQIEKENDN